MDDKETSKLFNEQRGGREEKFGKPSVCVRERGREREKLEESFWDVQNTF